MQARLERSGIRPISAIVDVTNYVMLELGQPLHAYDRRHVDGDIVVRFARPGETLTLLNGEVLALAADLLLVADSQKPLGLAGIMGGEHSGIGDDTRDVLLEGAFWLPDAIQGRMRRLGFTSDAGYRFERGVDFELGPVAVERATQLIVELCGGRAGPMSDVKGALPARAPVRVRPARVARLLGIAPDAATIASIFERLGFAFRRDGSDFVVTPPSYRFDLAIEEDFVEEIARIHGYDAIPATIGHHAQTILAASETQRAPAAVKDLLVARGWQEIVTFSFVAGDDERALDASVRPVAVENPIASHLDVMRTTLLPGLLRTLASNVGQGARRARIFEYGRTFRRDGAGYAQPMRIGGLAFGPALPEQWGTPTRGVDYFDVKGDRRRAVPARKRRHATRRASGPASGALGAGGGRRPGDRIHRRTASAPRSPLRLAGAGGGFRDRRRRGGSRGDAGGRGGGAHAGRAPRPRGCGGRKRPRSRRPGCRAKRRGTVRRRNLAV